jgi:hypothetical protein
MSKKTATPECFCLSCGKLFNAASDLGSDESPSPGDISMCLGCGHLMAFTDDMTVRELTSEEMHEVAGDPYILAMQRARGKAMAEMAKLKRKDR